jgi:hypothetical protein
VSAQNNVSDSTEFRFGGETHSGSVTASDLDFWPGCPDESTLQPPICRQTASGIDPIANELLMNLLNAEVSDTSALCIIDAAVVQSYHHCIGRSEAAPIKNIAQLMAGLARQWQRAGARERTEELFAKAVALLSDAESSFDMPRGTILRTWIEVEIEHGDLQHARALAALYTANSHKLYRQWPIQRHMLVDALDLEASILSQLGLAHEAQKKQEEASALMAQSDKPSVCWTNQEAEMDCGDTRVIITCRQDSTGKRRCWGDRAF